MAVFDASEGMIRAFEAGRKAKMDREEAAQRAEDRKLEREVLQHRIRELKLNEQFELRKQAQTQGAALEGTDPRERLPGNIQDILRKPAQLEGAPEYNANQPTQLPGPSSMRYLPMQIPGVIDPDTGEELFPGGQQPIKTLRDQMLTKALEFQQSISMEKEKRRQLPEDFTLGPGQKRFSGGKEVAFAPPQPKQDMSVSETELYIRQAGGDKQAAAALKSIQANKKEVAAASASRIDARMVHGAGLRDTADAKKRIRNRVDTFTDATRRLGIMEHALANPNPQNDVALLFNHIGMTLSAQRGARITNAEIHRAITARSLPADLQAMWQRVVNGEFLTPEQRTQMVELARHGVEQSREDALSEADTFGISIEDVAPGLDRRRKEDKGNDPFSAFGGRKD